MSFKYDNGYFEGLNNKPFNLITSKEINFRTGAFDGDDENYRKGYIEGQKKRISDQFEEVLQNLIEQTYLNDKYQGDYEPEKHLGNLLKKYLAKIKNKMSVYNGEIVEYRKGNL